MNTKKLGQEPALPYTFTEYRSGQPFIKVQQGLSKRLLIAKDMMQVANTFFNDCSVKFISEYIGITESEYTYDHYKKAVVKYAIELADELLKQEAFDLH